MKRILVIVGIAVLIIAGVVIAKNQSSTDSSTSNTSSSNTSAQAASNSTSPNPDTNNNSASSNEITYSSSGFSPATLTVKSGDKVTVKNNTSSQIQFDSNPHPLHTDDPELNIGLIGPGESQTITVTKKGSHGFHNHLNPSDTGTLVVQ